MTGNVDAKNKWGIWLSIADFSCSYIAILNQLDWIDMHGKLSHSYEVKFSFWNIQRIIEIICVEMDSTF